MGQDQNTLEQGTYEIIQNRLVQTSKELEGKMGQLNDVRKEVFGAIETQLLGSDRLTTEYNCSPRAMFTLGQQFIFAYNIHMGLKSVTSVSDVFARYEFKDHKFSPIPLNDLNDETFVSDFQDLYKYYKPEFLRFAEIGPYLYMIFQTGKSRKDIKTFKWLIDDSKLIYQGNRFEHEYTLPPQHEFKWTRTHRDLHRSGLNPHISIEDKIFVETVGGDLTVKIEDNTLDGAGIYAEPVDNADQTLDDAEIFYAIVDGLILLKIKPYQENNFRYLIYSEKTQTCHRVDGIEGSCVRLPDSHGVIFANGYFLNNGELKIFDSVGDGMQFIRQIASPNGEDFLYEFYNPETASHNLLSYNLIEQSVNIPISCSGFTTFDSGEMVVFREDTEPKKHHSIQYWQTPYTSVEFDSATQSNHALNKIGNKDIVKAMSECSEIIRLIRKGDSYMGIYVDLVKKSSDVMDAYFWLNNDEVFKIREVVQNIQEGATSAVDEFEKVQRVRKHTHSEVARVSQGVESILRSVVNASFVEMKEYVEALSELRKLRGEIISLKELRYVNLDEVTGLEKKTAKSLDQLSQSCVEFLLREESLDPYRQYIEENRRSVDGIKKVLEANELEETLITQGSELEMLIDIVSNLKIEDSTQTTQILDSISEIYGELNQVKVLLKNKKKDLQSTEVVAEFNAQLRLLNQGIINYLDLCDLPAKCDEYLTKLMVQLEELEAKVSDFDEFIEELSEKREEIYNAFESKKQTLVDDLNRKSQSYLKSAERILKGIQNRIKSFKSVSEINGFFATDLMVDKSRTIVEQLRKLGDSVKADDIESKIKSTKEEGIRQLKDKLELFTDGENIIQFGKHKFSVNTQELELTTVYKDEAFYYHLTGTQFYKMIQDPQLEESRSVWNQKIISENSIVYRGEFLAWKILQELNSKNNLEETLKMSDEEILSLIQTFMAPLYSGSYMKGVHDVDALKILKELLNMKSKMGLLSYSAPARSMVELWWSTFVSIEDKTQITHQLIGLGQIKKVFPKGAKFASEAYYKEYISGLLTQFIKETQLFDIALIDQASDYLIERISQGLDIPVSIEADGVFEHFKTQLQTKVFSENFKSLCQELNNRPVDSYNMVVAWVQACLAQESDTSAQEFVHEISFLIYESQFKNHSYNKSQVIKVKSSIEMSAMMGDHSQITKGNYSLEYIEFARRLENFQKQTIPLFQSFHEHKSQLTQEFSQKLRLSEFKARVLSSFVRNQLIDQVYLPLIGDNLAKQMGVVGENKRTDLMGMLLLISPPGYGKTTLMEYVANRLGLIFMKINGPAIGHQVTSLDPMDAPNATAKEEVEKLNLAFEMGDNVMIYLDDIQHCNPEFLQKFISLCDGQRKIEGVFEGKTKTYDLRGRKVAVVMAGNPYTESGDKFQIPDMLANRADTYNLGDILGSSSDAFELSYIENSLTSNSVLQSMNSKSSKDVYAMVKIAQTGSREGIEFEANYGAEETNEIVSVLKKMLRARDVILKVNMQYIKSAGQADEYRTEPPFKLQGSYRNMNKISEKIVSVMNDDEFEELLMGHYDQESQTLTSGAESNILKFKELLGKLDPTESSRWTSIQETFTKNNKMKNLGGDSMTAIISEVSDLNLTFKDIKTMLSQDNTTGSTSKAPGQAPPIFDMKDFEDKFDTYENLLKQQELTSEELVDLRKSINRIIWTYREFIRYVKNGPSTGVTNAAKMIDLDQDLASSESEPE